jgi:hypothetical protein
MLLLQRLSLEILPTELWLIYLTSIGCKFSELCLVIVTDLLLLSYTLLFVT